MKEGAKVEKDIINSHKAFVVQFEFGVAVTTFRLVFEQDELGVTNMTTLPISQIGKGFGAKALEKVTRLARDYNFKAIKAVQISDEDSENFWKKNGFIKDRAPNRSNDYILHISE